MVSSIKFGATEYLAKYSSDGTQLRSGMDASIGLLNCFDYDTKKKKVTAIVPSTR